MADMVPYYDAAHSLIGFLHFTKVTDYEQRGIARMVRSRGEIIRAYRIESSRILGNLAAGAAAVHAGNRTTERIRIEQCVISPPKILKHKRENVLHGHPDPVCMADHAAKPVPVSPPLRG